MLNALRRSAGSWLAKLLFILLVISFAAWGIGDYLGPSTDTTVARVGDTEISEREFTNEFNRQLEQLRQRFGGRLDRETAIGLGLADQVLSRLVSRRLVALEAEELGIRIGDDLVRRVILEEQAFHDATGRFDRQRFEQVLFTNGLTEEGYVERLRNELSRGEVIDAVVAGAIAPAQLVQSIYRHRQEERIAEILYLPLTKIETVPEPDDQALATFYEENNERFERPELRRLTAIVLSPQEIAKDIPVPEERVREAYEARIGQFQVPERRRVAQLLFAADAEEKARAAAERLSTGAAFDDVAEEATATGAEMTDIGEVTRGDLFPAVVEEAAFGLEGPGTTEPVKSPLGWHILRVTEIVPGSTKPFEEVAPEIRQEIAVELAVEDLFELGNQVQDALAGGSSLEEVAESLNLPLLQVDAINRQGLAPDGSRVSDIPDGGFLNEAFSLPEGEESLLEETPEGGYYVLRVDEIMPPAVPPLDEIRDEVAMAWRGEKLTELAEQAAQNIAASISGGATFESIAAEMGLEHRTSSPFTRDTHRPGDWLPSGLVGRLFNATSEEVVVQRGGEGFYVARVTEVRDADPSSASEAVDGIRTQLEDAIRADLEMQYIQALQNRHGVEVRQETLRRLL